MSKKRKRKSRTNTRQPSRPGKASRPDLKTALRLHQTGHMREAETIYQQLLEVDHRHVQANHLMGILYYQTGRIEPAIACYQKTIQLQPGFVDAYSNLGIALRAAGRPEEAISSFKKALAIDPDLVVVYNNLGNTLRDLGQTQAAILSYRQALERDPKFAESLNNLGNALVDLGRLREAVESFRKSIELKPNQVGAYNNLGNALRGLNRLNEAVASYQKATTLNPDFAEAHHNLGNGLSDLNRMDEALASFQTAIRLHPGFVEAHNSLGLAFKDLGRMDQAIASFKKAIAIQPDYTRAHANLSYMRKHSERDGEVRAMTELYDHSDIPDRQRIHLAFGLARVYENIGEYDRAFEILLEGHRMEESVQDGRSVPFDLARATRFFEAIEDVFDNDFFEQQANSGFEDESPVFILGMPRSGTSLVEQILASHPQVHGAGELKAVGELTRRLDQSSGKSFPEGTGDIEGKIFHDLGTSYVETVRGFSKQARFITDKMPANFLCIGLIIAMLPKARFIHCLRDPMDTCFSIFKSQFSEAHDYARDLAGLGGYYLLYERLMAHWHKVLPGRLFDIQYEQLVQNSEAEIRKMLDYCNLPFDEACLSFYKTERVVKTASATQVRQPIYGNAVSFWKNYENHLVPLQSALKGTVPSGTVPPI